MEETWRQTGKGSCDYTYVCRHQDRKLVEIILGSLEFLMNSSTRSSERGEGRGLLENRNCLQ